MATFHHSETACQYFSKSFTIWQNWLIISLSLLLEMWTLILQTWVYWWINQQNHGAPLGNLTCHSPQAGQNRLRLQAPHSSKAVTLTSKTPIQGIKRDPQQGRQSKKNRANLTCENMGLCLSIIYFTLILTLV